MSPRSRLLILIASLALGLGFLFPLWKIQLDAPQYPEGLGMVIQVNTIEGEKPHDLQNINGLNHYIGMKRIEPDTIPELRIMPWVLAGLIVGGILVALIGRPWLLYLWIGVFIAVAVVGLVDFWLWEYDYGHNLDQETAIIKIPGMNYQPPLIGSKQLLNFTARSWPGLGGWSAILSCMIGVLVAAKEWRRNGRNKAKAGARPKTTKTVRTTAGALVLIFFIGCEPAPRPVVLGGDVCEQCLMGIADARFTAEIVTAKGVVYTFDSAECMTSYAAQELDEKDIHSVWTSDFRNPGTLLNATTAFYLEGVNAGSPMGLGIMAFATADARDGAREEYGGQPLGWSGVRRLVAERWPDGRPAAGGHGGHGSEARGLLEGGS